MLSIFLEFYILDGANLIEYNKQNNIYGNKINFK